MKRTFLLCFLLVALAQWAGAAFRPSAAMDVAARRVLNSARPVTLASVHECYAVYCQQGGGFAVISNDDDKPVVLAYSPDVEFSLQDGNPGFNWWLRAMEKSMSRNNSPRLSTTRPDPSRFPASVAPLITTLWGQREPFKFMCPFDHYVADASLYGTYTPDEEHYVAGCGPVAMAQYMNYYKFPKHGVGSESIVVQYPQGNVSLTVDFSEATYDWNNMIDDYQGDYTDVQGEAVARLCYHCGVASQSTYNSMGAGTTDVKILNAFINHFNYKSTAHYVSRANYDEPTWMEMLYTELSAGHPVLYSAKDLNLELGIIAGHNFIIDGYDENGLVHVNWGWYGFENGYFDVALLNVQQYTYDDWQAMYVDLYPNRETSVGDINGDEMVNVADVTALISIVLNAEFPQDLTIVDVNNDGNVNVADVTALIGIVLNS